MNLLVIAGFGIFISIIVVVILRSKNRIRERHNNGNIDDNYTQQSSMYNSDPLDHSQTHTPHPVDPIHHTDIDRILHETGHTSENDMSSDSESSSDSSSDSSGSSDD